MNAMLHWKVTEMNSDFCDLMCSQFSWENGYMITNYFLLQFFFVHPDSLSSYPPSPILSQKCTFS